MNMQEIEQARRLGLPANARRVAATRCSAVVYVWDDARGRPCAAAFAGRRYKADWRFFFRSQEARLNRVNAYLEAVEAHEANRRKRERQGRGVEVGDVLCASWGYEQTNIDWYEVTALLGDTMVEVRALASAAEETQWLQGKTVPLPGNFLGEPMRRRAVGGRVKIDDVRTAFREEPLMRIGSKAVYKGRHYTAYH